MGTFLLSVFFKQQFYSKFILNNKSVSWHKCISCITMYVQWGNNVNVTKIITKNFNT